VVQVGWLRRCAPLWLVLLVVVAVVGAVTVQVVVERVGLWRGIVVSPHFTLVELSTTIRGLNRVDVKVTLKNTDTAVHAANVTVQLLDKDGEVVAEQYALTGDVPGGAEWSYVFVFREKSIVERYDSVLVVVSELR
jgi:hypothetical protein